MKELENPSHKTLGKYQFAGGEIVEVEGWQPPLAVDPVSTPAQPEPEPEPEPEGEPS